MAGADRDWVNLANAFVNDSIRISWGGIAGTEYLRPYLDKNIVTRLIDLQLPWFTYLIQEEARKQRSSWLWTKIMADHAFRLWTPFQSLRQTFKDDPVDLVISNTAGVTIGLLAALFWKTPHIWCIKECLDTNIDVVRRFTRLVARSNSTVVVPSKAVAKSFSCEAKVIPDGTNVERVQQQAQKVSRNDILNQLSLPTEDLVVAQVGGIIPWKGQHVMAEAFVRLVASEPVPYFSLLFLGDGDERYKKKVEVILDDAPRRWRERVRFASFEPDDFTYLNAADIIVHPSVLPDPYPNAVREAMVLGKPVIASRDGGIPEMISHEETGLLVEPGNAQAFAEALRQLLCSVEKQQLLGSAAQAFAIKHFDIKNRKSEFLSLFRALRDKRTC